MATLVSSATREKPFFLRMIVGISVIIVIGFAQFAARGYANYATAPLWVHLHGFVMVSWLGLMIVQSSLIQRGSLMMHRQLGVLGVLLAAGVVVLGSFTALRAIALHRVPPFFTDAYFLALSELGLTAFAGLIIAAVVNRRRPEWHRRLMLGAAILLTEPAFGRLLPMPLLDGWGEWLIMLIQLGALALVARHDRRRFIAVHPATLVCALVVVVTHVLVALAAKTMLFTGYAASIAAN
ncbi:MAG: hypothetical protein JWQ16_1106 [Novosphingobium sp.]|nr:hypothetical protein [Novosphingobium sp.]